MKNNQKPKKKKNTKKIISYTIIVGIIATLILGAVAPFIG